MVSGGVSLGGVPEGRPLGFPLECPLQGCPLSCKRSWLTLSRHHHPREPAVVWPHLRGASRALFPSAGRASAPCHGWSPCERARARATDTPVLYPRSRTGSVACAAGRVDSAFLAWLGPFLYHTIFCHCTVLGSSLVCLLVRRPFIFILLSALGPKSFYFLQLQFREVLGDEGEKKSGGGHEGWWGQRTRGGRTSEGGRGGGGEEMMET
jgi:hypothetical protein